jgi:hypothetical protein
MLETNSHKVFSSVEGINQQDFDKIQLLQGAFPYQVGLQQRIPGKIISREVSGSVGSIFVFYNVFGRHYILTDYGTIEITETILPPITLPALPPSNTSWFDTFSGYDVGLVSRIWAAGVWAIGIGICETLIQGIIDPFLVYDTIKGNSDIPTNLQPKAGPNGVTIPNTTPTSHPITASGATSKVYSGSNIISTDDLPYPSSNYPSDNSGWLPGGHGDLPFLPHPYDYAPLDTRFFSSAESGFANSYYNNSGGVNERQNSSGYYSDNFINLSDFTANDGDIITLYGTRTTQTDRFGSTVTENVEIVLGIYPELPERFTVVTNMGPKISADISSPPGSNRLNVASRSLTYTGYNVYPFA